MKAFVVHLMNCFPAGQVNWNENQADAYDVKGNHRVALRKNGAGVIVDAKKDTGASDAFSLDPIPKNARVFKLYPDDSIGKSEEAEFRIGIAHKIKKDGKVLSIAEYKASGQKVDAEGNVILEPAQP